MVKRAKVPTSSVPATAPVQAQVSAPMPFVFGLAATPASTQAAPPTVTAPITVPKASSMSASRPATTKGKGTVSTSPVMTEPTVESNFVLMPGEVLRSCCEDWIEACSAFMEASPLCPTLSQRWVRSWKQRTLIELGQYLGPDVDEVEYDEDDATTFIRTFFRFNLLRRMDGPDTTGKNAILDLVGNMAAKEGLDLGPMSI